MIPNEYEASASSSATQRDDSTMQRNFERSAREYVSQINALIKRAATLTEESFIAEYDRIDDEFTDSARLLGFPARWAEEVLMITEDLSDESGVDSDAVIVEFTNQRSDEYYQSSSKRVTANRRNSQFASRSKRSGQFRGRGLRGWFGEKVRHAKSAMGIKTGRKRR